MRSPIAGNHVVSNKTCRRSPAKGASQQVLIFAGEVSAVNSFCFDGLIHWGVLQQITGLVELQSGKGTEAQRECRIENLE